MAEPKPLVLDVDGTFLKTDLLFEAFWAGLGRDPVATLRACVTRFRDRAGLKAELAATAGLRLDLMPVNPALAELALESARDGREVVLASASDQGQVRALGTPAEVLTESHLSAVFRVPVHVDLAASPPVILVR